MGAIDSISIENLRRHVKFLSGFEKLSGSNGAHDAVSYMSDVLKASRVKSEILTFDEYLSDPISSVLQLENSQVFRSRPRSFSKSIPEGIYAPLVFDDSNQSGSISQKELNERLKSFKDKIVISHGYDERYAKLLEKNGALGWIQVWNSPEEIIHEDTVGSVWGTPDLDSSLMALTIPVICVNAADGETLIKYARENPSKNVYLSTMLDTGVRTVEVPIAYIEGESDEFILVSGHYDTWYAGAMDNVAANAACLEIARLFSTQHHKTHRGIRIAWWAGHSNGRYAGSAWYMDHFYKELKERCVAHLNSDLIGSKVAEMIAVITTGLEGKEFERKQIKEVDGKAPLMWKHFGRGADQSFWGAEIPYHLMTRYEVPPEKKVTVAPGGSPWWHTIEDTYEKISFDILKKETQIFLKNVLAFSNEKVLPVDFNHYFGQMEERLCDVEQDSDPAFDFSDLQAALKQLKEKAMYCYAKENEENKNKIVKIVGGKMNFLMQTYGSPYGQDLSYSYGMFPHLTAVKGVYRDCTTPEAFLFYETEFIRQKNRFLDTVNEIILNLNF